MKGRTVGSWTGTAGIGSAAAAAERYRLVVEMIHTEKSKRIGSSEGDDKDQEDSKE